MLLKVYKKVGKEAEACARTSAVCLRLEIVECQSSALYLTVVSSQPKCNSNAIQLITSMSRYHLCYYLT